MKNIFKSFKLFRRRLEYLIVISLLFIMAGYMINSIKTNNFQEVQTFFLLGYRALNSISLHIVPITTIFVAMVISVVFVLHAKIIQLLGTISIIAYLAVMFFVPTEISNQYVFVVREFLFGQNTLSSRMLLCASMLCAFLLFLISKKFRQWLFHVIKYGFEIALISTIVYFQGFYEGFNFLELLKNYWLVLKKAIEYLAFDNGVGLYVCTVLFVMYFSMIRAIIFHIKRKKSKSPIIEDCDLPKIGVCIPAYNEEKTILKTLDSLNNCDYPKDKMEIIVISDGSTDMTEQVVIKNYHMQKKNVSNVFAMIKHKPAEVWESVSQNIKLISKANGGKFDALNAGLQYLEKSIRYVCVIDSDTTIDKNSIRIFVNEALKSNNIVALAGTILPREENNASVKNRMFQGWQYADYISSFHVSRGALSIFNSMMIVSGAFGFFDRYMLLSIKGYKKSLGEDIMLTMELQMKKKFSIKYVPEAIAYTQVPTTFDMVRKQRMRWFKGLTEALSSFKNIWIVNPRMIISFLEFFLIEWLTPLMAPYGLIMMLAKPDFLVNPISQCMIILSIVTPLIQSLVGMILESSYRKVDWRKFKYLPTQIFMAPLTMLWRNDGLLDMSSKSWGHMIRS